MGEKRKEKTSVLPGLFLSISMKAISAQVVSFASMPLQHTAHLSEVEGKKKRNEKKMFCSTCMKAISMQMVSFANMPLQHKEPV